MPDPAERKTGRALLRRLALDTLGRTPSLAEAQAFLDAPVDLVAKRLVASLEAMAVFVEEELFYFLLLDNFRPKTESIAALPKRLADGKATATTRSPRSCLSSGFSLRNPGNDTFVTVVLEQCLGLTVQDQKSKPILEAGKKLYDGKRGRFLGRDGESQADVLRIVLEQEGFTRFLLERHRKRLFGAGLGDAGKDAVARVHGDRTQFFPLLAEWLASTSTSRRSRRRSRRATTSSSAASTRTCCSASRPTRSCATCATRCRRWPSPRRCARSSRR
jgi:hypothetical protein